MGDWFRSAKAMRFAIYSDIGEQSIRKTPGWPEYSYYFVLRSFLPALEHIGSITYVADPATELDAIFAESAASGERCLFISFSPPHKAFIDHEHPMIVVFAWEASTIPDEVWNDDPRNDWRTVFARCGRAITLSGFTARIVKTAMGSDFRILAAPGVIWDRFEAVRAAGVRPAIIEPTELRLEGLIVDSRALDLSPDYLLRPEPPIPEPPEEPSRPAEISAVQADPVSADVPELVVAEAGLVPPAEPEADSSASILFVKNEPDEAAKELALAPAIPKTFRYRLGKTKHYAVEWYRDVVRDLLPRWLVWIVSRIGRLSYRLARLVRPPRATAQQAVPGEAPAPPAIEPTPIVEPAPEPTALVDEPNAEVAPIMEATPPPAPKWPEARVTVGGVIYTSILDPTDARKNWRDLITGFCWTFRNKEDATLIIKMINADLAQWYHPFIQMLSQLSPFKCRVIALHGSLENEEYEKLIAATSYYVDVPGREGRCLPLMEFMSCGKPAIASRHAATEDYIDEGNAFILDYWMEHVAWPHDPRNLFRAECPRLNWESVQGVYEESYRVAKADPARYRMMAGSACRTMRDYCSEEVVTARLRAFFEEDRESEPKAIAAMPPTAAEGFEADRVAAL